LYNCRTAKRILKYNISCYLWNRLYYFSWYRKSYHR